MKRIACLWVMLLLPCFGYSFMYEKNIGINTVEGEEIIVRLEVSGILSQDIIAYIHEDALYLPLGELFELIGIKTDFSEENKLITGFFLQSAVNYKIDIEKETIVFGRSTHRASNDQFILDGMDVFIHETLLSEIFGLNSDFDFRSLTVFLNTEHELPAVREKKRQQAYANLAGASGEQQADQTIPLKRNLLGGGMMDWNYNSTASLPSPFINNSLSVNLGGEVLGGDIFLSGAASTQHGINRNQLRGRYRFVANQKWLNQIIAGSLPHQPASVANLAVNGLELTNRPVTHPAFFGYYYISDHIQPDWDIEMYVNNRLVDFTATDSDGYYQFQAPLSYGSTMIDLKYYGPWGEFESSSRFIQTPFTFVPRGRFEYSMLGGKLQNYNNQAYAQGGFRWGLSSGITLGGGIQHIDDPGHHPVAPFLTVSMRLTDHMLVHGRHLEGVQSEGSFSYRSPSRRNIHGSYVRYAETSLINRTGKVSEMRVSFSMPFRIVRRAFSSNVGMRVTEFEHTRYINLNSGLSSNIRGTFLSLRTRTQLDYREQDIRAQTVRSTFSLSRRLFRKYRIRPQLEYDHIRRQAIRFETLVERRFIGNSHLSLMYNRDILWKQNRLFAGIRIDFPSARHRSSVRSHGQVLSFHQTTSGTVGWDGRTREIFTDNRNWVGNAGLTLQPRLDVEDEGEQPIQIEGISADVKGGRRINPRHKNLRLVDLNPYNSYLVEIDSQSLSNPLWVPKFERYEIQVMPNRFNVIEVPIIVVGEVAGTVTRNVGTFKEGIRGINIIFSQMDGSFQADTRTYSGGHYFYVGLPPGKYMAHVDPLQLERLSLQSQADSLFFDIQPTVHGDIIENLDFHLEADDQYLKEDAVMAQFSIQIGAFINEELAEDLLKQIIQVFDKQGYVYYDPRTDYYHTHFGVFEDRASAIAFISKLYESFPDLGYNAFIVPLKEIK